MVNQLAVHRGELSTGEGRVLRPRRSFAAAQPLRVLLVTEGTYPFHFGGVSTWCQSLLEALPEVRFTLMSLVGDRKLQPRFPLPPNVEAFLPISMWGTHDLLETRRELSFGAVRRLRAATTEASVEERFVPVFESFLRNLFREEGGHTALARSIVGMHRFFVGHDFDAALRSRAAWRTFGEVVRAEGPRLAKARGLEELDFSLAQLMRGMQWIYHWLYPLARPLPQVDVVHAGMAGLCTLVAVTAKLERGAGYLLTEHGIYLREAYLAAARSQDGSLLKLLRTAFARRMTELSYAWADQVAPVCDYNHRWERRLGARPERLRTMYYGVDSTRFQPVPKESPEPVVVWVGRIDPLKDVHTLLRAAAEVHRTRPDVRFRLFGTSLPGTEDYHRGCLALREQLGLEDVVDFAGYVDRPATAFNQADVVVLSSISEAMPFSNLEAMLCGRPVVSTAVGGIPEQLAGCGLVVEPRNPEQLAAAILDLVNDPARRAELGRAAREKAMHMFGMPAFAREHLQAYRRLAGARRRLAYRMSSNRRRAADDERPGQGQVVGVAELAEEIGKVAVSPAIDVLEVAALVESMGVTDQVAAARHGARDVFQLAAPVLARLRATAPAGRWEEAEDDRPGSRWAPVREWMLGPLALVQFGLVLGALLFYSQAGSWPGDVVFSAGLGISAGIVLVSVLIQSLGRRPAVYLGLDDHASARAALDVALAATAAVTAVVALVVVAGAVLLAFPPHPDLLAFVAGFGAFSTIWIAGGAAMVSRAPEWLVLALGAGLGVGLALSSALSPSEGALDLELGFGLAVAVAVVLLGGRWAMRAGRTARRGDRPVLPSGGYLVHETGPYLAYGFLYLGFFVLPHGLSWAGALPPGMSRSAAIDSAERVLTLGLLPLLVVMGMIGQASGAFWRRAAIASRATSGMAPERFGRTMLWHSYVPQLCGYVLLVGAASAAVWLTVAGGTGLSIASFPLPAVDPPAHAALLIALVAYGLLGWALLNVTYTVSLGQPGRALKDLLPAAGVALLIGIPLSLGLSFTYAVVAFAVGALAFLLTSSRSAWRLLRAADYHYYASV